MVLNFRFFSLLNGWGGSRIYPQGQHESDILEWSRTLAAPTMRRLCSIVKDKKPGVIFLAETICPVYLPSKFFNSVGLCNVVGVDPKGRKGGLILAWAKNMNLDVIDVFPNWIHFSFVNENGVISYVTCVYGLPDLSFNMSFGNT